MTATARLNRIWRCNTISFTCNCKLYKSLVTSMPLYGCKPWTLFADCDTKIQVFETKCMKNFSASSTWSTRSTTGCTARSTSLWAYKNLFWQLLRDGNLHGSGMSHATTASPKPSFRAPWRVGDAVVGRGNAGWTTSKSGHPCPCQNCLLRKRPEEDLC